MYETSLQVIFIPLSYLAAKLTRKYQLQQMKLKGEQLDINKCFAAIMFSLG